MGRRSRNDALTRRERRRVPRAWGAIGSATRTVIFARWPLGVLLFAASILAASKLLVARSDPGFATQPALIFVSDLPLPRSEGQAPEIDVTLRARPGLFGGCNPVHVHVEVNTARLSDFGRLTAGRRSNFALGVLSPAAAGAFATPQASVEAAARLRRTVDTRSSLLPGHPRVYVAAGEIVTWPVQPYFPPLTFDFNADWAVARSAGSCFVELPALVGPPVDGLSADVERVSGIRPQRTLASRSALAGATTVIERGAAVSRQPGDTLPAPDDPREARWRCRVDHRRSYVRPGPVGDFDPIRVVAQRDRTCAGQVVLTRRAIQEWSVFIAFVLAVFASLGLQMVYDGVFRESHAGRRAKARPPGRH